MKAIDEWWAAGTRGICSPAAPHSIPIVRLPTVVFPGMPISMPVTTVPESRVERPVRGVLSSEVADEICELHDGKLALFADGCDSGVLIDLLPTPPIAAPTAAARTARTQ